MPNRLARETSPYLLQHADNPVDWYPWGDEAFARARAEHKPVLLSIGYAACHWCHVMAHESFEDDATARLMNAQFVNVKVDREERPDVDAIFMNAIMVQGEGGPTLVVSDSALGSPNGITWDAANKRMIIVPYGGFKGIRAWVPGTKSLSDIGMSTGAKYDGVEVLSDGRVLVSSQADSSIHVFSGASGHAIIHTLGAPADIAVDTKRNRVAVPVVALNHVEIFEIPR